MVADGYKQTEYGLIPNDWIDTEFQNALDGFSSGMTPYRGNPEYYKGSIKWITSGELNYNIIYDTIEHITLDAVKKTNLRILPKGTFLMAITGLEAAGTRGSCAIVGAEATTNQSCMAIFSTRKLSVEYFYHFYVRYGNLLAFKYCQGTKQQSYTAKIAKVLPIIYPPDRKEQQAIATALSDTDELINSLEKLIFKKEAIKTGTMQELLTGKKRLDGFSGEWEEKTFKDISSINQGLQISIDKRLKYQTEDSKVYITIQYLNEGKIVEYIDLYTNSVVCNEDDILMTRTGNTGEVITNISGVFHNNFFKINYKKSIVDKNYFVYFLTSDETQRIILAKAGTSTIPDLNHKDFYSISMKLPTIKEQIAIATILSDMDSDMDALKTKLFKVKAIKEGMMQELLTGKTRLLRGATDEHP